MVFLEAQEDVAMEKIAGPCLVLKAVPPVTPGALSIGIINAVEEMWYPTEFVLHCADAQAWVALEDAGEEHVTQRHAYPVIGVGEQGGPGTAVVFERYAWRGAIGGDV